MCRLLDAPENQDLRKEYLHIPSDAEKAIGTIERINTSFRKLDLGAATKQLTDMVQMFDVNSNFDIMPNLSKPGEFTITPRQTEGNPNGALKTKISYVVNDEIRKFGSFINFTKNLYFKQKKAELIVQEIEQYSGEELIMRSSYDVDAEHIEIIEFISDEPMEIIVDQVEGEGLKPSGIITIYPPPMPEPFPAHIEIDEEVRATLSLQTKEIDEQEEHFQYIVSNLHQSEAPYLFEMSYSLPKRINAQHNVVKAHEASFGFSTRKSSTAFQLCQYSDLLHHLVNSHKFSVIDLTTGSELMSGSKMNFDTTLRERAAERDFWKDVVYIERKLGHQFEIPEVIDRPDIDSMYELIQVIRTGILPMENISLKLSFEQTETNDEVHQIIRDSKKSAFAVRLQESDDYVINTLGKEFNFGKRLIIVPELKVKSDAPEIKDETVSIDCLANILLLVIPEYYGTDELIEVLEKEGYKSSANVRVNMDH